MQLLRTTCFRRGYIVPDVMLSSDKHRLRGQTPVRIPKNILNKKNYEKADFAPTNVLAFNEDFDDSELN